MATDGSKAPIALFWIDLESDRLIPDPVDGVIDFRPMNIMEVAVIVTDFDLNPITDGYREAVKMTPEMAQGLRENEFILDMHRGSGLVKDCIASTHTLADIEDEIIAMLKSDTTVTERELQIAGSGVAAFDHPVIKALMPKLARWLHYAPFDIGVLRRSSKIMAKGDVVNVPKSYKDGVKTHRAWDDVEAHLEEGVQFRDFYRRAVELGAHIVPTADPQHPEEEPV